MEDDFRGRVFALADMMFNAAFVVGAAVSAAFMPVTGHSAALVAVAAVGYLVTAAGYRALAGHDVSSPGPEVAVVPTPESRAQRSSS